MSNPQHDILEPRGRLNGSGLDELCTQGSLIEAARSGRPKILRCSGPDGEALILKLWYLSRELSSARLYPYSSRFRNNARRLSERGVSAPEILGWGDLEDGSAHYVCYRELPGASLRDWIPDDDLAAAARFIAGLHQTGIDFRSLHMGNILWDGQDRFSLVDVTDCGFKEKPLGLKRRTRRVLYFCFHRKEHEHLVTEPRWKTFVRAYCESAQISQDALLRVANSPLFKHRLPPGMRQIAGRALANP